MRHARRVMLLCALLGVAGSVSAAQVQGIRVATTETGTRVVLDLSAPVSSKAFRLESPARIVLDLPHSSMMSNLGMPDPTGAVSAVRSGKLPNSGLRLVFELNAAVTFQLASVKPSSEAGHRLVLDLAGPGAPKAVTVAPSAPAVPVAIRPAHAPSESGRDIIIAVDAGHGGVDPGASGRRGTREKDVVLEVAKALAARIDREPGMKAVLTRDGDYFIPLGTRVQKARRVYADLFVSVHADAFMKPHVRGSSVFALSERGATSAAARWLAKRENEADLIGGINLDVKDRYLKQTLLDLSQTATINDSLKLAKAVLSELGEINTLHKSYVEQAGFAVLKAPDIPSILVETAFISNPDEENRLRSDAYQTKLADAVFQGIKHYFSKNPPLAREKVATR